MTTFKEDDFALPALAVEYLRSADGGELSYEVIADKVGCNKSQIYRIHTGGQQPRKWNPVAKKLKQLAVRIWKRRQNGR